jgi:peptide/nickel transport system substrate-binding protein
MVREERRAEAAGLQVGRGDVLLAQHQRHRPLHARQARGRSGHRAEEEPEWWGIAEKRFEGNVDEVVYRPIKSDATRMAALLTGELDLVLDPPLQDIPRLKSDSGDPHRRGSREPRDLPRDGPEPRRAQVLEREGKNPLKDLRVRQAFYMAIDIDAIRRQVMRGQALPPAR